MDDLKAAKERRREINRAYYLRNAERIRKLNNEHGRALYASSPEVREQVKATSEAWRKANSERVKAKQRQNYEANKEIVSAQSKAWYAENKAARLARCAAWRSENKGKAAAYCRSYQAAKKNALPAWVDSEFEVFALAEAYSIAAVRSSLVGVRFEVDHIVPLRGRTVSGLHCIANLQVIPATLNASKGNRHWPDMPA